MREPWFWSWLLERLVPAAERAAVLGDLSEEFAIHAHRSGARAARKWYRRQVLRSILPVLRLHRYKPKSSANEVLMYDAFRRELAYAVRTLRRSPAFTLTAMLTLGAGIGLSTGVFSVARAAVLRPLPYEESERLLVIEETRRGEAI